MADPLDSIVKGAPLPAAQDLKNVEPQTSGVAVPSKPGDPLSSTPSSPSMIYLNLLILEASFRAQYLELRARRRHHSFFLLLLSAWTLGFGYALFLAPREDGSGVGGSVYWMVEMAEKVCFMGGVVTAVLVWATGIWDRGVRWPRKWFGVSNRGLRGFNCKLVVIKRHWWTEALSTLGWFLTYGLFSSNGSSYRYVEPSILREVDKELKLTVQGHTTLPILSEDEEKGGHEEDVSPGGDYVKVLLLAKPFSPTFRENWELYRTEYWERENERRALIRAKLRDRDRKILKTHGGWFWWLPWRKAAILAKHNRSTHITGDPEKHHHHAQHPRHMAVAAEHRRTRSSSSVRRGSVSAASSRSPTPSIEVDESGVSRKASTASSASEKRRKKPSSGSFSKTQRRPAVEGRSLTPEIPSPLARESSVISTGSES
ncbi:Sporulation-specific protein spo7 [Coniochaeta hoffmannii]|uniref:Sporulation-specific protein spo7 n=1 Tax=Coniochaeta hoffmannii TaxID=91930 RepID=A0AA38VIW7_9PEZI|nr:Sporulation-specific protein spo7 [Coniochaeta hoffmannii]